VYCQEQLFSQLIRLHRKKNMSSVRQHVPLPTWWTPTNLYFASRCDGTEWPCESGRAELRHFHNTVPGECRRAIALYNVTKEPKLVTFRARHATLAGDIGFIRVRLLPGMTYLVWCGDSFYNMIFVPILETECYLWHCERDQPVPFNGTGDILPGFILVDGVVPQHVLVIGTTSVPSLKFLCHAHLGWSLESEDAVVRKIFKPTYLFVSRIIQERKYLSSRWVERTYNVAVVPEIIDLAVPEHSVPGINRVPTASGLPVIVIGASHSKRLTVEFDTHTGIVGEIYTFSSCTGGWVPTPESVLTKVSEVESFLSDLPRSAFLLLWLLDNSIYQAVSTSGTVTRHRRDNFGRYHVPGFLDLIETEEVKNILISLKPLLSVKCRVVLVTPLPRYLKKKCCSDLSHIKNFSHPYYKEIMFEELEGLNRVIRENVSENIQILDPVSFLGKDFLLKEANWNDGVHLSKFAYGVFAKKLCRYFWSQ